MDADPMAAYVDAAAALIGLPIPAAYRDGVLGYFRLAAGMAALVQGLPLTPEDELAESFVPIGPDDLPASAAAHDGAAHG